MTDAQAKAQSLGSVPRPKSETKSMPIRPKAGPNGSASKTCTEASRTRVALTNRPPGRTKELDRRFPEPETGAKKRIIFGLSTGILEEPQEAVQTPAEPVAGTGSEAKPAAPKNNTATPPAPQKKLPPVPGPVQIGRAHV